MLVSSMVVTIKHYNTLSTTWYGGQMITLFSIEISRGCYRKLVVAAAGGVHMCVFDFLCIYV